MTTYTITFTYWEAILVIAIYNVVMGFLGAMLEDVRAWIKARHELKRKNHGIVPPVWPRR